MMTERTVLIGDLSGRTTETMTQDVLNRGEFTAVVSPAVLAKVLRHAKIQPGPITATIDGNTLPWKDDLVGGLQGVEASGE
jgi:hypothetical protein